MNVFSILGHLSLLIHLGQDVESIAQNLIQKKESFPTTNEFMKLIDDVISILSSGLINLPPDVVKKMNDSLSQLKSSLTNL